MATDAKRESNRRWVAENRDHIREYREKTKDARNARRRELYAKEPARRVAIVKAQAARRRLNPLARRCARYGITTDAYELMANEGCAICRANPEFDSSVRLHIDHDHDTGVVRGLLCQRCNLAIGHLDDDPIRAIEAANYLVQGGVYAPR